ncbi:DNA methyltransferase [Bacteroides heparinolyticus]|uniref:DNA methyltransferase n=1 Tax=Prevotella heparinolytica TaxID=28113 RepID=UPI003AF03D02
MKRIPDASVDCILTDPPYLYLKHKLDRPFDERRLFGEFKRVLKPKGFVVLFGRGTSFYRWNTELSNLGFDFKEEIVWDKSFTSSPLLSLSRVHETISVHTLRGGANQ